MEQFSLSAVLPPAKGDNDDEDNGRDQPAPPPLQITCFICGRQFGTSSLQIHQKTCVKKHAWGLETLPKKKKRVQLPSAPVQPLPTPSTPPEGFEAYNEAAMSVYMAHAEVCAWCSQQDHEVARRAALQEERRRREEEEERLVREEEERRRREEEEERLESGERAAARERQSAEGAEQRLRQEEEERRQREEEERRRREEEAVAEAARRAAEEEERRRAEIEARRKLDAERRQRKAEEEAAKRELERQQREIAKMQRAEVCHLTPEAPHVLISECHKNDPRGMRDQMGNLRTRVCTAGERTAAGESADA
ncbi:hypothetical protein CYMTET_34344, partial [Cymbomonas tetramitiformis]